MTTNTATYRRILDASNAGDPALIEKVIDEVFHPDVVGHSPLPIQSTGAQAVKEVYATLHRAFPDMHIIAEDVIEEGEKVVARQTVTGSNLGEYMGRPATGKSVTYNEIFIFRFSDGRIAETWGVVDVLSQLKQLGVIPS